MEWLAFLAGVVIGMLMRTDTSTAVKVADIKGFAIKPLAKLKGTQKRAPKYNDDRKAAAIERDELVV